MGHVTIYNVIIIIIIMVILFSGTSRHLCSQTGITSGPWNNGDIVHRNQNGGTDVDFRCALSGALRLRGTLDEGSLSTRSSPVHRPTKTTSDLVALVRQVPRPPHLVSPEHTASLQDDSLRRTAKVLPVSVSSWSRGGAEPWWAARYRGDWVDSLDHRSATVGRRRLTSTEDPDVVDRTGLSRSTACLLEARCDGRNAPVTVAISQNL